jgi:hypothetical protein
MTGSRLDELPDEVQSSILFYLSTQSLIRLYQTSHYWKCRISNDKQLWRSIYEHNFSHEFAKDRWILWAVRRLWSQSLSEEKRLAARRVSLTTLEHLDGYTWYRLVRGRMLTMRNWRNNMPQRIVICSGNQSDMPVHERVYRPNSISYGIPIISDNCNKLGFGIIDDTLNDTQLVPMPDTLKKSLPSRAHCDGIALGKIVPIYSTSHILGMSGHVTNDEFLIVERISEQDERIPIVMLVWNLGQLEMHNTEHQSYYTPSLCMAELLPHDEWEFLEQQSGWLLIKDFTDHLDESTQQYLLYDIRRGRLAMSFSMEQDTEPIMGKVTPNKVQIYYGHIAQTSSDTTTSGSYQYYWHTIEVSIQSGASTSTVDLTWYDQTPTSEAIETVRSKYRAIVECVKDHGYWCGEGYLLKTNSASKGIQLPVKTDILIQPHHLIDDLFLLSSQSDYNVRDHFLLVHSLSQPHVIWSKNKLTFHSLIPEEKSILTYDEDNTIRLLGMYTGNVLNSFNFQEFNSIRHIIGPLFSFHGRKYMLIDVRTGEIIRILESGLTMLSWIFSVLPPDRDPANNLDDLGLHGIRVYSMSILGPTCMEYISTGTNSTLIFEYAQI